MVAYRPDYEFLLTLNDLEFGYYIERCFDLYKQHKPSPFKGLCKKEEDIEEVKNKLIDTIQKIMVDQNFTPTANSRVCSYCDHAKSGACPTGVYRNKNNSYRKQKRGWFPSPNSIRSF